MNIPFDQISGESRNTSDDLGLSDEEVRLLRHGVMQWGGPARSTEALAVAMGFSGNADLFERCQIINKLLRDRGSLDALDWTRALFATEISFVSDIVGSGIEWSTTTGISDLQTVVALRSVQKKLLPIVASVMRQERVRAPGTE